MNATNDKSRIDSSSLHRTARAARALHLAALVGRSGRGLAGFLTRRLLGALRAHAERRRRLEELMNMDDRMLRDMGLSRSSIVFVFENGRAPANSNEPIKKTDAA